VNNVARAKKKLFTTYSFFFQDLLRKHGLLEVNTPSPFMKRRLIMSASKSPRASNRFRAPKIVIYDSGAAFVEFFSPRLTPARTSRRRVSSSSPRTPAVIPLTPTVKRLCATPDKMTTRYVPLLKLGL
jgi:hypothetical protein